MNTVIELKQSKANTEAEFNTRIAAAEKFESERAGLARAVEDLEDKILTAQSRRAYTAKRVEELKITSLNLWPVADSDVIGEARRACVSPFNAIVESHASVLALESMLQEWPSVNVRLLGQLSAAKKALTEFEKSAPK